MAAHRPMQPPDSDGIDRDYPANNSRSFLNADGTGEYYREIEEGEGKDILWRSKAAQAILDVLNPGHPDKDAMMLDALPANYKLYEHNKVKPDGERKDTYLYGHPNGKRFRSSAEFRPHVLFLAANTPSNAGNPALEPYKKCGCAYCSKGGSGSALTPAKKGKQQQQAGKTEARKAVAIEERIGEQETAGWVFRKGEIVWVWTGSGADLVSNEEAPTAPFWEAGVVVEKPSLNTSLALPVATGSTFADIEATETSPWEDSASRTYTIQICNPGSEPGEIRTDIPQHYLRPWLSRPLSTGDDDTSDPSLETARQVTRSFSLFDRGASSDNGKTNDFGGVFLGAEKIFINEPVRIANPGGKEDVMVLSRIYTKTESKSESANSTVTMFVGHVYTNDDPTGQPLTPEQFAALPFRMRRQDGNDTGTLKWLLRNGVGELGELSIKYVLGRWYEPKAVNHWMHNYGDGTYGLGCKSVKVWTKNRAVSLSWARIGEMEPVNDEDRKTVPAAILPGAVTPKKKPEEEDKMDLDEEPVTGGFKSVNSPGETTRRISRVLSGGEEEEEQEEASGVAVLSQSPTKRLPFR